MKLILFILSIFIAVISKSQNQRIEYILKYRFVYLQDSTKPSSKKDDIMMLVVKPHSSIFFSYLRQFGERNLESDIAAELKTGNSNTGGELIIKENDNAGASYFITNLSEILILNYRLNQMQVEEQFERGSAFFAIDTLKAPIWELGSSIDTVAKQVCQSAKTFYKGRHYTAWFAPHIPFKMGPWFFNGLPGLILKVEDNKKQFMWEAVELNLYDSAANVFMEYSGASKVSVKRLREMQKIKVQNYQKFQEQILGRAYQITDSKGNLVRLPDRPYNPIDLTNE